MRRLDTTQPDFDARLTELLAFETAQDPKVDEVAAAILADVKARGDTALVEHTQRLDRLSIDDASALEVSRAHCEAALETLPHAQREALVTAIDRVRTYHEHQRASSWRFEDAHGNELGQQVTPLDRVGVYVIVGVCRLLLL